MENKILITGGTGTIGSRLSEVVTSSTIFSRNEAAQIKMKQGSSCKFIIGDICSYSDVLRAAEGKDYVFHFAAMKHVDICERQPIEAARVNILGTMNVITVCQRLGIKMINMSSDKAINPVNVYGRTKALAEAMATQAGFLSIRSGNVLWSSGSVLPIWKGQLEKTNIIKITSEEMTRFFIHVNDLVGFILKEKDTTGIKTVFMQSFRLSDIAAAFIKKYGDANSIISITGLRDGERLHEFRDGNVSSKDCISDDLKYIFQ